MKEQTLIIIKPEAVKRNLDFKILGRIKEKGFSIVEMYQTVPSKSLIMEHYSDTIEKCGQEVGEKIVKHMNSPLIVAIIQGDNAVQESRRLCGNKIEPKECEVGTIRFDYSNDSIEKADLENRAVENIIHTSDSKRSAEKEIRLWFPNITRQTKQKTTFKKIAESIGFSLSDLIKEITQDSNKKRLMYHGIKKAEDVPKIKNQGIKSLTPEGSCSFWSTGIRLFHPSIDSPFFNYSGNSVGNTRQLNLAMTSYELLENKGLTLPTYQPDSQLKIKETIPFKAVTILSVITEHPESENPKELRKYRQKAEQMLLRAISSQLLEEFIPGKIIKYHKKIDGGKE